MQWLNEDHRFPLNRSSFKDAALTTDHDLSDFAGGGGGVQPYRYVSL